MNRLLEIYQSVAETDSNDMTCFLNAFSEHQAYRQVLPHTNSIQAVAVHITGALSTKSTRHDGLVQLHSLLPQCSPDLLQDRGITWMSLALKVCQCEEFNTRALGFRTLTRLLKRSVEVPDLQKYISSNSVSKIIDAVTALSNCAFLPALRCLRTALVLYHGPCGPHKDALQKHLLGYVDCRDEKAVREVASCLHMLQQIGGGGAKGNTHKANWKNNLDSTINSVHGVLDALYENCIEVTEIASSGSMLSLPKLELSDNPVSRASQLVTRLRNLCCFLRTMLIERKYPVAKSVPPLAVLSLVARGMGVTCASGGRKVTSEWLALSALLPSVHVCFLKTLDALILCLGRNLLCFGQSICKIVSQTLKWTTSTVKNSGQQKPYGTLRIAAYETLSLWLGVARGASNVNLDADSLINYALEDATPYRAQVTLTMQSGGHKNMSKKARQALQLGNKKGNSQDKLSTAKQCCDQGNIPLCVAALKCLEALIKSTGNFLKPDIIKVVQEHIVKELFSYHRGGGTLSVTLTSDYKVRLGLYDVLLALVNSPCPGFPPPTSLAVHLFAAGQNDPNVDVSRACTLYMLCVDKIIHPAGATWNFPSDCSPLDILSQVAKTKSQLPVDVSDVDDDESVYIVETDFESLKTKNIEDSAMLNYCGPSVNIENGSVLKRSAKESLGEPPVTVGEEPIENIRFITKAEKYAALKEATPVPVICISSPDDSSDSNKEPEEKGVDLLNVCLSATGLASGNEDDVSNGPSPQKKSRYTLVNEDSVTDDVANNSNDVDNSDHVLVIDMDDASEQSTSLEGMMSSFVEEVASD